MRHANPAVELERSAIAEHGAANGREVVTHVLHHLAVALGGRLDAQRAQQCCRGSAWIAGAAEHRVQPLVGEVMEHQIDDYIKSAMEKTESK